MVIYKKSKNDLKKWFFKLAMQLTSFENLTNENIKFKEAKVSKVKDSNLKYKRIPIEVIYPNNKKGPLKL